MHDTLSKYKIGFLVLGAFTLVLLVLVLAQAGATKHDSETYKAASKIADKLNSYTTNHATVPESLDAVNIDNSSDAIRYVKLSSSEYKFCVTYKANSSDFDPSAVETSVLFGGAIPDSLTDDSSSSYLYIPASHHKGENCQKVTVDSYGGITPIYNSSPQPKTSTDAYCSQAHPGGSTDDATVSAISTDSVPATITVALSGQGTFELATGVKVFNSECDAVDTSEILQGDKVKLIFDKAGSKTVAAIIDNSF